MMTTLTAMRARSFQPWGRWLIIGIVLLGLSGCSAVRLGYNNGPSLVLWQLDRWLDLDSEQQQALRPALAQWFDWHRSAELPTYAATLAAWREAAAREVDAAEVCAATDEARRWAWRALDAALPAAAEHLPKLGEAQWRYLAGRQAERLAELRAEFQQPDPAQRRAAALARAVERAQDLYGPLAAEQRALLAASLARSPADPERWLDDRARRQRELVEALRQAQTLAPDRRVERLRAIASAYFDFDPTDADGAGWRARWRAHNCETSARLHNSTTPAQRERLRQRLLGWEQDLRALAAAAAS
jgi:hypothetical protein